MVLLLGWRRSQDRRSPLIPLPPSLLPTPPPNISTCSSVSLLSFPVLGLSHCLSMNNKLELKGAPETDSTEVETSLVPASPLPPSASEGVLPTSEELPTVDNCGARLSLKPHHCQALIFQVLPPRGASKSH